MNDAENSSSQGKSQDVPVTSSSAEKKAENPFKVAYDKWGDRGPNTRVGVACKCGAHTSVKWEDGGAEWLASHVQAEHRDMAAESASAKADAERLRAGIGEALVMESEAAREHLRKLIAE